MLMSGTEMVWSGVLVDLTFSTMEEFLATTPGLSMCIIDVTCTDLSIGSLQDRQLVSVMYGEHLIEDITAHCDTPIIDPIEITIEGLIQELEEHIETTIELREERIFIEMIEELR